MNSSSNSAPLLVLEQVWKSFPAPAGGPAVSVLRGVNLAVAPGESVAVVGPSGSGKSTLLSLMGGLDAPTSGRVLLDGRDLASLSERERAQARSRRIGFVFQYHHLLPQCSVWENVLVPTLALPQPGAEERARRLLERVGLSHRLDHRPAELSGGECLRAAVARALINRPAILLADEPTGSLDAESAAQLAELLVGVNREEAVSLVVVTHSLALAARLARRLELRGGVL